MQLLAKFKKNSAHGVQSHPKFRKFENLYGVYTTGLENLTCKNSLIHLIHKWLPTWNERAAKHGIEAF